MTNALTIFNQLRPHTIGYDSIFDHFNDIFEGSELQTSYPPYDIIKHNEAKYDIQIELSKGINDSSHNITNLFEILKLLIINTIILPLIYDTMVLILLIKYLIDYTRNELTNFEYIYSIILCIIIGIAICAYSAMLFVPKLLDIGVKN